MHTSEQVKALLEILEISEDKIEILLKEQSLEQAYASIDLDLLVIYYNCFQYEETWEHISQVLGNSAKEWIRFIENQPAHGAAHQRGIQSLLQKVFVHINPWYKYEKAWKELLKHCEETAQNPRQFKDWIMAEMFENPPETLEVLKILFEHQRKPKFSDTNVHWRSLTDKEFQQICELEDSVLCLRKILEAWYAEDVSGKMELYRGVLEKIAEHSADLDNVRYVWDFIKNYEKRFAVNQEEIKLLIRRTAFKEYKLPTVVNPMFF